MMNKIEEIIQNFKEYLGDDYQYDYAVVKAQDFGVPQNRERFIMIGNRMGVSPKARLLPPQAVKYVCEDYCIDLPPELQDQRVLKSHQLYQKVVRELQLTTFFDGKWTKITEIPPDF